MKTRIALIIALLVITTAIKAENTISQMFDSEVRVAMAVLDKVRELKRKHNEKNDEYRCNNPVCCRNNRLQIHEIMLW